MQKLKILLGPMRVPFLLLTPCCVLLGTGTAIWRAGHVSAVHLALAFLGAVSAHISVNALNEYFDFKSGLDFKTRRTPFSGGSGTLPANVHAAHVALATGWTTFALTGLIGIYFLYTVGLALLPLGLLGLLLLFLYTPWFTRNPWLCLLAPGLGFGPLMVAGTDFVLTGGYSWTAFIASLVPFFLVSNLLLLNQFPDIDADRSTGRRHFPITAGPRTSSLIYGAFLFLAYLSIVGGVLSGHLPAASLLGLLTVVIAVPASVGAWRHGGNTEKLVPYMGMNVVINLLTPVLTAIGLFIA